MRLTLLFLLALLPGCRAAEVPASALRLRVSAPASVSRSVDDSLRFTIHVANPRWRPVYVDLGPDTRFGAGAPRSEGIGCGWQLRAASPGGLEGGGGGFWGQHVIRFGARATRRCDFAVALRRRAPARERDGSTRFLGEDIVPGEYLLIASFGKYEAAAVRVFVRP